MAYFNHAFEKAFLATSVVATNASPIATSALSAGQLGVVTDASWQTVDPASVTTTKNHLYLVQGSFRTQDNIGNNPGHGGYAESVKSKGINPRYITRIWSSSCETATQAEATVSVGSTCAPCGSNFFLRLDVKGSPALRFLNHNAYAIGDSSGDTAQGDLPGLCCAVDQEYLDPAVALAKAAKMLIEDPIIAPFAQIGDVVVTVGGTPTTYTVDEVLDGTYTPSVDPVGDAVTAELTFLGAYVDTKFGNCSFDTRDHYEKEPVQLIASILDETGDPCNDCGVVTLTPGTMAQTTGETVLRDLLLTESYMQSPYNQGNVDSARIREIEGSDSIVGAVDRNALYKVYYLQHSVPRLNNPTGVFDNDQYVYKIYVACDDSQSQDALQTMLNTIASTAASLGNPVGTEFDIDATP